MYLLYNVDQMQESFLIFDIGRVYYKLIKNLKRLLNG